MINPNRPLSMRCTRIIFQRNWQTLASVGSRTQSKQWRIKLLYRYKRAKTSRITVLNIRTLNMYFVYFKHRALNCMFTLSGARQLFQKLMCAQHLENLRFTVAERWPFCESTSGVKICGRSGRIHCILFENLIRIKKYLGIYGL